MRKSSQDTYELDLDDNIYWLFDTDNSHQVVLAEFIQNGLANGERVLIVIPGSSPNVLSDIYSLKIPGYPSVSDIPQIRIVSQADLHQEPQSPRPDDFFRWVESEMIQAKENGYPRLRITAPIDDYLLGLSSMADLLKFENQLKSTMEGHQALALWQVPVNHLDPYTILGILISNPKVILGDVLLPNQEHFPPGEVKSKRNPSIYLYRWLEGLAYRKKSEGALEIHDRWFRDIFDTIYQFVGVLKPDGTLIEINRAALEFAGVDRSDVIGRPFWKAPWWSLSPQIRSHLKTAIGKAAQGEFIRYPVDMVGNGKDGPQIRRIDFSLTPVFDAKKQVVLLIPEARDLTEIIHTQKALEESDLLLQSVISSAPIILFLVNLQGTILLSAGKGRQGLDQSRSQAVGRSIYDLYKDYPVVIKYFQRALKGESFSALIDVDGNRYDTHYSPFLDNDGNIIGVLGVATDVTRHKKAVDALVSSQARFQVIFEESGIGISLEDLDGRVIECNRAFQEMLGYSAEELYNRSFTEFTHPADLKNNLHLYKEMTAGKRDSFHLEKRYVRKDGKTIWGRLTTSLFLDQTGEPEAIIVMVEDITAMKQMEAELQEVQRRLMEGREQERLHLAQEIHDGPLQEMYAIVYKLKELEANLDGDQNRELLHSIQDTVQGQINGLRALAGELRPPLLIPFGLEKAIQSHAESFMAAHPGIQVNLDLMPDKHLLSEQVRKVLFRIYQELMNNVVRHAQATRVAVHLHIQEEDVFLDIQDNGQGFKLPKRWIELARQNHLGLVGAQERAESIGGHLVIESEVGRGTNIRVVIPRQPSESEESNNAYLPNTLIGNPATWIETKPQNPIS